MPAAVSELNRSLGRVGRELKARNDSIAAEMVSRIRDQVPAYSRADPAIFDRITELSTATALAVSEALINHVPVRRGDVAIIREQAADRLRSGIDLESFLHAYRAALFFYWDTAMEEATRLRLTRSASHAVGRFILDSVDTITTHAAEAFLREDNRMRTETGRATFELIDNLIVGRPTPNGSTSMAPGLRPSSPMQVIVGRITAPLLDLGSGLGTVLEILQQSLALGTAHPLGTVRNQEAVMLAPGSPPISRLHSAVRTAREQNIELSIGVSDSPTGFAGIPSAYATAVLTLSYSGPNRRVVSLADLTALQLLLLDPGHEARSLIHGKAAPLRAQSEKERATTLETIEAFAGADMNITGAASALDVHPNTVRYRLTRIAETTGIDPRTFPGLADLHCIIELDPSLART